MFVFESSQGRFTSLHLWRVDEHVSTSLIYIFHIHAVWCVSDHRHAPLSSPGHLKFYGSSPLFRHHCRKKKHQKEINFPLFSSRFSLRILWNVKDLYSHALPVQNYVLKCKMSEQYMCVFMNLSHVESKLTIHLQKYVFSLSENEIRD